MRKILFFIEGLSAGGKERRVVELAKNLSTISPLTEMIFVLFENNIHFNEVDKYVKKTFIIKRYFKKDFLPFFKFIYICFKEKPNFIHVWGNLPGLFSIPASIFFQIPIINNQITNFIPNNLKIPISTKINFKFSKWIIANSQAGLNSYNLLEKVNKSVIYNGINLLRFKNLSEPIILKNELRLGNKIIVGMVANFTEKKDYKTFLTSAMEILETRNDVSFICIGAGPQLNEMKQYVKKYSNDIHFLGNISNVEIFINIFDICVLVSFAEGFSNSIMEYMALNKVVIATDHGGTSELVVDNETGFLISVSDHRSLTSKLILLLDNGDLRNHLGRNGRKRIEDFFTIDKMSKKFLEIYNKVDNLSRK